MEVLIIAIRKKILQKARKKVVQMGKEEEVLPLFAINMILYLENHKKPKKIFKQLKLGASEQGCNM